MQTEAIRAFVTVCDQGSFQAAANALHLSQPTISKRLASLETRLGHELFDRVGRGVALTEAGRAYLPHARELLAVVQDGRRALDNLHVETTGPLRLALSHHVGLHRMPEVLRAYVARHPNVTPEIVFLDSEAACRSVVNGDCELAVITLPTPPHPGLVEDCIWNDPMSVFVGQDHALANAGQVNVADLARYPAVLPPVESYTYDIVAAALAPYGLTLDPRMTSHYLETLRMLAGVGIGWTVLPTSMQHPELTRLELPGVHIERRLGAIRHPRRSLSNAARALLTMLDARRD
ncbi:LysR family transcriptional regulator [Salinisphaera sp.]|uniref:LysR family transcriptional regulator n=1 Tax=Salinisphaera sp. TaxID=1914330 RepID=UPI000C4CC79C|nr:LysR family transcriptional regulator [Salinisphaera sp.]MBS62842.1 LysR family transcriptional regulator [Salinisphaera sp.]